MKKQAMKKNQQRYNYLKKQLTKEMVDWLSTKLDCSPQEINIENSFIDYDIDSIAAAQMLNILEKYTNFSLEVHLIKDHKTISELANYLAHLIVKDEQQEKSPAKPAYDQYFSTQNSNNTDVVLPDFFDMD